MLEIEKNYTKNNMTFSPRKNKTRTINENYSNVNKHNKTSNISRGGLSLVNNIENNTLPKISLNKHENNGFNYKISNLISELIRFKIWKLNHQKLKPVINKKENLNYFQKSEKSIDIKNTTKLETLNNKSLTNKSKNSFNVILSKKK